jgi:radical SAM superfamily enzyme YgiQ (UPF0313 family)
MPHVALLSFSGLHVREPELAELGVSLPGLAARGRAVGQLPALGLLTLAGMLPDDWTCSYREIDGRQDGFIGDLVESLVREGPTLVAMSALSASVLRAYELGAKLRAENIATVLGGLHAAACPQEAALHVDAVCVGEGELVWPEILADAAAGRLKSTYGVLRSPAPLRWAMPRFELVSDRPYHRWTLQTQRGCPLACEFCGASRLISRFREKPVEQIQRELAAIGRCNPHPIVELADDNTFAGSRDAERLLSVLAESGARYFTEVDWRIGEQPQLLSQLAASGCVQVLVGLESLVFRYPGMGAKDAPFERVVAAVDRIQEAGVAVIGCFIAGADGETHESLARLTEFLLGCRMADVQVTLHTPFPGTPLRARLAREGRLLSDRDWSYYTLFDVTFRPDRMSALELTRAYRQLLATVFAADQARRRAAIRRDVWRRNPALKGTPWPP